MASSGQQRRGSIVSSYTKSYLLNFYTEKISQNSYTATPEYDITTTYKVKRSGMANWLLAKIEASKILNHLWTTYEAHFDLNGQVNSKNNVSWGSERSTEVTEKTSPFSEAYSLGSVLNEGGRWSAVLRGEWKDSDD